MKENLVEIWSTVFFFAAILHVFFCDKFQKKARNMRGKRQRGPGHAVYEFLGNSTLIFGMWLIPILIIMIFSQGGDYTFNLLQSINYLEPFAYFVLITLATVRPVLQLFDAVIDKLSSIFHNQLFLWWTSVLLLSSILTGIFSEIAIMTLTAQYLSTRFLTLKPSKSLMYFTFSALLLVIAVGTTILPFNFNFFFNVLDSDLSHFKIFKLFGWKTLLAIILILSTGFFFYGSEFKRLQKAKKKPSTHTKISARHIFYLLLFLIASFGKENPYILMMVIATVVIFHKAIYKIKGKEGELSLYLPLLIAFFTTTLEIHAKLQKWWVEPLLAQVNDFDAFGWSYLLTGLNEHVPLQALKTTLLGTSSWIEFLSYLGILAGGGLTFIAKSSNIVAKKLLKTHFPEQSISPIRHLVYAVPLTFVFAMIVLFLTFIGG